MTMYQQVSYVWVCGCVVGVRCMCVHVGVHVGVLWVCAVCVWVWVCCGCVHVCVGVLCLSGVHPGCHDLDELGCLILA